MQDWRSYDSIAEHYDGVWSARFEQVARQIWARVSLNVGDAVLDIGTGTGIVLRVCSKLTHTAKLAVGCDRSLAMVRQARAKAAGVHFVVADATALPFRDQAFHIVLASFVLSHVPDYTITLSEMLRVTRSGGTVAVSNWAPPSDPYSAAWNELLAGAISRSEVERASEEVAPWEAHFSQPGTLHAALSMAGFAQVTSFEIAVESDCTVEQFLEQRALSGTGRLGRHLLGPDGWARFRTNVREELHARFGPSFRFCRGALIGLAKKS